MNIKPIHNEQDYKDALKLASAYFDSPPEPNTAEGDHFEILLTLIESYEAEQYPINQQPD